MFEYDRIKSSFGPILEITNQNKNFPYFFFIKVHLTLSTRPVSLNQSEKTILLAKFQASQIDTTNLHIFCFHCGLTDPV